MKNKKEKFGSPRKTLVLLQQLQIKYFGTVEIEVFALGVNSFSAWVGTYTVVFYPCDTSEERESKYNELLTYINTRL